MGYMNRFGKRPPELASKSAHTQIVNDPDVVAFLEHCDLPKLAEDVVIDAASIVEYSPVSPNPARHVVAIDAGYSEVVARAEYPSAVVCFFQFGALFFAVADLDNLDDTPFIDPGDIAKLKQIQRLKLTLPIKNVRYGNQRTLTHSVRQALFEFFCQKVDGESLVETLRWFLFEEYRGEQAKTEWILASSPYRDASNLCLRRADLRGDFTWASAHGPIYLTDVFRLHERIDDELGAGGIEAYTMTAIEQLLVAHAIRLILQTKPSLLNELLFVKDGPLAFFGQTARMHEPMRALACFLLDNYNLFLVGLEKSGAFVEHAHEIKEKLRLGSALILTDEYIYRNVIPGTPDPSSAYGRTTYYGAKIIFRTPTGAVHVASVPTRSPMSEPTAGDLANLPVILTNIEKLRCDMYDDALLPVALVNKLVSLSNHPSSKILQQFAKGTVAALPAGTLES
jgi:hypothetical protein